LDKDVLFGDEDQAILQLFFGDSDINQPIEVESGWTILHYATLYGGLAMMRRDIFDEKGKKVHRVKVGWNVQNGLGMYGVGTWV
jgi:hypothetical protein